jgi:hypothetical protein
VRKEVLKLLDKKLHKTGDSFEEAIIIDPKNDSEGIREEYEYLENRFGECGVDWERVSQGFMQKEGKSYDRINLRFPDGSRKKIFFDVGSWWGKL